MEKNLFTHLIHILNRQKKYLLSGVLMIFTANILLILNPFIIRKALSLPEVPHLWLWIIGLVSISLVSSTLRYRMRVSFVHISREAERQMRSRMFEKVQSQSMEFYDRHGIGELTSRLSSDVSAYRDVLGAGILFPAYFTTIVIPGLLALFIISPFLGILSFLPIVLIPLLNLLLRGKIYNASTKVQEQQADMNNFVQEDFAGIRIVKAYVSEGRLADRFAMLCKEFASLYLRFSIWQGFFFPLMTVITRITTVLLVVLSGAIIVKGYEILSAADFIAFMWIQSYIFFPILILGWVFPIYQQGRAAYDRLKAVYEEPIAVQSSNAISEIPPHADIVFNHLTFTYPGRDEPALNDINLTIKSGSFTGITGPIGSGKSTLFKILNREYEIPRSMLYIGGIDIHDIPLSFFYNEMVSVEQIPFLFSKSIKDNVRFGNELASQEEVERATKLADLHETVLGFQEGYETLIGEKGVSLSGGQKQRVAIARALLVNRSILLLDDIFSAVDLKTEERIFRALKENFKGKTVLLTTQRISVLEKMDSILFFSKGEVIQEGSPHELLKNDGPFKTLKELQRLTS